MPQPPPPALARTSPERPHAPSPDRPTILIIGRGDPIEEAVRAALVARGVYVESFAAAEVRSAIVAAAPDMLLLLGDAAEDGGRKVVNDLISVPHDERPPVVLLSVDASLESRLDAFRRGIAALVPRSASVDEVATRIEVLSRELGSTSRLLSSEATEATLDELLGTLRRELRNGVLSVHGHEADDQAPVRLVLRSGEAVASAMDAFIDWIRPLVARAEPVTYEFTEEAGDKLRAATERPRARQALDGLRMMLVASDAALADVVAEQARQLGAQVLIIDPNGAGLERARHLDPHVVVIDERVVREQHMTFLTKIRADLRLRWASIIVASARELGGADGRSSEISTLVRRLSPLLASEHLLRERLSKRERAETRLDAMGPARLLRVLAQSSGMWRAIFTGPRATVHIDVSEELVAGATATVKNAPDKAHEGSAALAMLLAMSSGWARIQKGTLVEAANVMTPLEEALARASVEPRVLVPSDVPPRGDHGLLAAMQGVPLRAPRVPPQPEVDSEAVTVEALARAAQVNAPAAALEPADSEIATLTERLPQIEATGELDSEPEVLRRLGASLPAARAAEEELAAPAHDTAPSADVSPSPTPESTSASLSISTMTGQWRRSPIARFWGVAAWLLLAGAIAIAVMVPGWRGNKHGQRSRAAHEPSRGASARSADRGVAERANPTPSTGSMSESAQSVAPPAVSVPVPAPVSERVGATALEGDERPLEDVPPTPAPAVDPESAPCDREAIAERRASRRDRRLSETRVQEADTLSRADRNADAAERYCAALELDPSNAAALAGLARVELAMQRPASAVAWARRAVDASSHRLIYRDLLVTALQRNGETQAAETVRNTAYAIRRRRENDGWRPIAQRSASARPRPAPRAASRPRPRRRADLSRTLVRDPGF